MSLIKALSMEVEGFNYVFEPSNIAIKEITADPSTKKITCTLTIDLVDLEKRSPFIGSPRRPETFLLDTEGRNRLLKVFSPKGDKE